jgi:hypothetical protein
MASESRVRWGVTRQELGEAIVDIKFLVGVKIGWQMRQTEEREDAQVGKRAELNQRDSDQRRDKGHLPQRTSDDLQVL